MSVSYKLDNSMWVDKLFTLPYNLKPNKTKDITIYEDIVFENTEIYDFSLSVNYNQDLYNNNDTINIVIKEFEKPNIDLGPDIYTAQADTVVLQAQEHFTNYQWQDFSDENFFKVTNTSSASYSCIVNNAYGCIDSDTVNIFAYDIGVSSMSGLNSCTASSNNFPTINIQLNSEDTLRGGDEIEVSYKYGINSLVTETVVLTDTFTSAAVLPYTFSTPFTVSDTGDYTIFGSVAMVNEVVVDNNTLVDTFRIGTYLVDLGDDIASGENTTIIDAGAGFASYLWSDNATTQSIVVNTDGKYKVTTTDVNGCVSSDSVNVRFFPFILSVVELISPEFGCGQITDEEVLVSVKNTGREVTPSGTKINIGYQAEDGSRIDEVINFSNDIQPNQEFVYNFTNRLNITQSGSVNIEFHVEYDSYLMSHADYSIMIHEKPVFFGGKDEIYDVDFPYILDSEISDAESYLWSGGETSRKITVSEIGTYILTITQDNTCEFTDQIFVSNLTGIYDEWSSQIAVYPNPAESEVSIVLPEGIKDADLSITDMEGKTIYIKDGVSGNIQLNISNWSQGVYLLRISEDSKFGTYQIIKK
jgi:hypothetical protein